MVRVIEAVVWVMSGLGFVLMSVASANPGPAASGLFALADDAGTASSNPAGLTRLDRTEWLLQGMFFSSSSEFDSTLTLPDSSEINKVDDSDGSLFVPLLSYARPINDKLTVGVSGSGMSFGEDLGDDSLSRYLVKEWDLTMATVSPAFGYKVTDQLSLGASLNVNYTNYEFKSAIFNGIGPGGEIEPDGELKLDSTDITVTGSLGLLYEFSDRTRVGLSYRGESDAKFSDTPDVSGVIGAPPPRRNIDFETTMPAILGAGIYHELENGIGMTLDALWIQFSDFGMSEVTVDGSDINVSDQNFEDVWAFSAGVSWPLQNRWTLKGGVMATSQFIDDDNRTRTFTMDAIAGVGAGFEYQWKDDKILAFNLNYFDMGDGPVDTTDGNLSYKGEYDSNYAIGFDVSLRWLK